MKQSPRAIEARAWRAGQRGVESTREAQKRVHKGMSAHNKDFHEEAAAQYREATELFRGASEAYRRSADAYRLAAVRYSDRLLFMGGLVGGMLGALIVLWVIA